MRAHAPRRWLLVGVLALGTADCSLLGLDRIDLPHCTMNSDCAALNTSDFVTAHPCQRYACQMSTGACIVGPLDMDGDGDPSTMCGGTDCDDTNPARAGTLHEQCDGVDNNCNDVIDDGVVQPRATGNAVTGLAPNSIASYGAAPMGTSGFSSASSQGTASFNLLHGAMGSPSTPQPTAAYRQASYPMGGEFDQPALVAGCEVPEPLDSPPIVPATCNSVELAGAIADASNDWILADVNTVQCPDGQLRVGFAADHEDAAAAFPNLVLRGPPARSNIVWGVDIDPTMEHSCTGHTLGVNGAARPAVGSLLAPGVAPQALVAYLAEPVAPATCGGPAARVQALGVWLANAMSGGQLIHWTTGTGNGIPQTLGMTNGGGRPAIAGWTAANAPGWFVAYGNAAGHAELRFVSALGAAPAVDMNNPFVLATSPPLTIDVPFSLANGASGPADQIALSIGHGDAMSTDVGVAWIEACASPTLFFARAHYTAGTPGVWTSGMPVAIATTTQATAPTLAYVSDGFVLPGYARNGATAAAGSTGGWVIAWADTVHGIVARRIAEFDAQLIDEPPIVIATPASQATAPFLYPDDPSRPLLLRFAYLDGSGAAAGGDLLCGNGASIGP